LRRRQSLVDLNQRRSGNGSLRDPDVRLADDELLHFAADGHSESVDESGTFGNFQVRYFARMEIANFPL